MSLFVWYFGTDRQYDDVPHHMILLGPRYKGLLDDIFKHKVLAEDFSLYLHRPTATDPSLAPPGCDAFYVLSPVPHLDSGRTGPRRPSATGCPSQKYLSDTVLPGLAEHVVSSRMLTPQDFRERLLSVKGAAFGLEPDVYADRLISAAQPQRGHRGPVPGGRGHAPGCGHARRDFVGHACWTRWCPTRTPAQPDRGLRADAVRQ